MKEKNKDGFTRKLATFIVDRRNVIIFLYVLAMIFSVIALGWVNIENDVTKYLPADTETSHGLIAMNENFVTIGTAQIMVSNITYETACDLYDQIVQTEGVAAVIFDDTKEHYTSASALYDVNFTAGNFDQISLDALAQLEALLSDYDTSIYTSVGYDENALLGQEMLTILIVASIIVLVVLILTSRAYMEVVVLLITFAVAALLNMGTNFIYGTISFISNSVAVVLQLAMATDYAIILCHRFTDEYETKDVREAAIIALSKAIPEISGSSLTTVSGLAALAFMKFTIGLDMSMVLIKAILLSLLAVFTLMPGLLVMFAPLLEKTRHKRLLPNVSFIGKFAVKTRRVVPILFIFLLIGAFFLSSNCPYVYSFTDLESERMTDRQHAYFRIKDTFGVSNMAAIIVPGGDYEAEAQILEELNACPEVKSTMGLSGIEAMNGYTLTEALTPRELAELTGLDYEVMQLLYTVYAAEHNQYGQMLASLEEYRVPLFDMFLYLKDQMETNNINLSAGDAASISDMFAQLDMARAQMQSDNYSRMVVYLNVPEEGQQTYDFLQKMRDIIGKYYDGDYYILGNSTSSRDLSASFMTDNLLISVLSAFFVIVVLLFTFRSAGLSLLLITVIQGSIWINFSIPTLLNEPLYFLGYLIANAVMMGANIDYAIVISSYYLEYKKQMHHKEAIVYAVNSAFPTIFTSGTIMASAGLLIGNLSAQPVVSIMGTCMGRGTLISMCLVLFVLPAFLVLGDSIINRTSFRIPAPELKPHVATGTVRVQGHVRGYISGVVDADINGIIHGQLNAMLSTEGQIEEGGSENV